MTQLSSIEQLTLDFARLVAGYENAQCSEGRLIFRSFVNWQKLPDYPNDWDATIGAIEAPEWMWSMSKGYDTRLAMIGIVKDGRVFRDETPLSKKEPPRVALMRAAVEAAKHSLVERRRYGDRDNAE